MAEASGRLSRRGRLIYALTATAFALTVAALIAATAVAYFAYERQSDEVENVQARNRQIEKEHASIGAAFQQQSKKLDQAVALANGAYLRGVRTGKRLNRLPKPLRRLETYAVRGFLVPRAVPRQLTGRQPKIHRDSAGYAVRWANVAVIASSRDPLSVWTRQAWPGSRKTFRGARRTIYRLRGPSGVVYAWREDGRTYAVLTRTTRYPIAWRVIDVMHSI